MISLKLVISSSFRIYLLLYSMHRFQFQDFPNKNSTNPLFHSTNKCFLHQTLSVSGVKNIVTAQNGVNALKGCTLRRHDDSRRHRSVAVVTSAVSRAITTIRRSCYRALSQNCRPPRYVIRISSISAFVGDTSGKREV